MIALVQVPAKVGTGFALVNLLPGSPPTSLIRKLVPAASGSKAMRKGFLKPEANVSWHTFTASV